MEAFQNLFRLISAPLSAISDDQINSLSDRHLQDFCEAKELSSHGGRDVLINRILCARNAAAAGVKPAASTTNEADATATATAAAANNSEFDEFDDNDDEFASFDMEAAISSTPITKEENAHPNMMSQNSHSTQKTPAKRPLEQQSSNCSSSDKRSKTPEGAATPESSTQDDSFVFEETSIPPQFEFELESSLLKHFGHSSFREGQLKIIHSILQNRDACAFWATGAGKSLTYQLPPLHLNQVGVIITPLVSLMMDQVAKLNSRGIAAAYLGSAQRDASVEGRVMKGEFRLIYVTPEKLVGGTFLESLGRMHDGGGSGRVCIFAVDESHCVSEWGHDFRPEFLKIGSAIRSHSNLASIPILALTATAVPRVQDDILKNLHMKLENTTIVKKSFDRPNLKIVIKRKPKNGALAALAVVVKELFNAEGRGTAKSTIVYCATRKEVDDVSHDMIASLAHMLYDNRKMSYDQAEAIASQRIKAYHAGLSTREETHISFLVGKTPVIVATVAFGMGIDKPDIRRVVHWGPPKTVEEYYQQMGRASRDGLPGEAIMYCDLPDFGKYKSNFYLKDLKGDARKATEESMDALREFCMSDDCCRRASLMRFFNEEPSFGKWCGTCDICLFREANGDEVERDFAFDGARVLLIAVGLCNGQAWSTIESVIMGKTVESYKYTGVRPNDTKNIKQMKKHIANELKRMKKKRSLSYLKELIDPLISKGLLTKEIKQSNNKYRSSFVIYKIVSSKIKSTFSKDRPIVLPVPQYIRDLELAEAEKRKRALEELEKKGVDLQHIPEEEKEAGEGEAIAAYTHWFSYIGRLESSGRTEFINQMDDLKAQVIAWRLDIAEQNRIAPTAVMAEHLVYQIAYATATLPCGQVMEKESLSAAGVGSNGIDELTNVLAKWTESVKETKKGDSGDTQAHDVRMYFKPGEIVTPSKPWKYAVYRPNKKTGMAAWEASYVRFNKGEHPQTIAMTQQSGKAIQVSTVIGHLLDALVQGRAVDLHRLASQTQPPTKEEWDSLTRCELETGMDVTKDPATSGKNSEKFAIRDFLLPIMGEAFVAKDYKERTPEESEKFSTWCGRLNWYAALRKVGYEPSFGSSSA